MNQTNNIDYNVGGINDEGFRLDQILNESILKLTGVTNEDTMPRYTRSLITGVQTVLIQLFKTKVKNYMKKIK